MTFFFSLFHDFSCDWIARIEFHSIAIQSPLALQHTHTHWMRFDPRTLKWRALASSFAVSIAIETRASWMKLNQSALHHDAIDWIAIVETRASQSRFNRLHRDAMHFASISFNLIQFDSIWFNFIQFDSIWFNFIQFDSIWFNLIQFHPIWFNLIQFDSISSNLIQFHPMWFNLIELHSIERDWNRDWIAIKCVMAHHPRLQKSHLQVCGVAKAFLLLRAAKSSCGMASMSRLLKIICLFCKRALYKRRSSAKETYLV